MKKRILFIADRTALIEQTRRNDFKHFKDKMTIIKKKVVQAEYNKDFLVSNKKRGIDSSDKAYEVFLGLYQGLSSSDPEIKDAYKDFSEDFFDLVIVDECHRGSAKDDSAWREILTYFKSATHIGLTATPKETEEISNIEYFGEPVYTYSLRKGIDDGFLAPYRVIRVGLNVDLEGWRPEKGKLDKSGKLVEDRIYNKLDFDKKLIIDERTQTVAGKITEFLKGYDRFAKTIVFCSDIDHAERMRYALTNLNSDLVAKNSKYIMQITGDNEEGKKELDNFTDPEEKYPVIATTSELMTTGVDAQTCKLIVLDCNINSPTKFKQIIGRGTRVREDYDKRYFTILDFKNATDQFADRNFDGDPIRVKPLTEDDDLSTIIDDEEKSTDPIIDCDSGEEIKIVPKPVFPVDIDNDSQVNEIKAKVYVNRVDVSVLVSREIYFDEKGKPITMSLVDHTKQKIKGNYASLSNFITRWNSADKKEAVIKELEEQGIFVNELLDSVKREVDVFDLICHVAFDQPPLTRKERADNVRKRDYFTKYGDKAKKVLDALLDKYADEGIENIENIDILKVKPLTEFGSPVEIVNGIFGSKSKYMSAIKELEKELYKTA
jgi:type I restriction enzyme R subunit